MHTSSGPPDPRRIRAVGRAHVQIAADPCGIRFLDDFQPVLLPEIAMRLTPLAPNLMLLANPCLASKQVYTGRKTGGVENQGDAHVTARTSD